MDLLIWRHPRPLGLSSQGAARCVGQLDLPVDRRRAKRLAHRIRQAVRRAGRPREIRTSPLRRGADVGRWLARWGWRHHIDARLCELDFGHWEGRTWDSIGQAEIDAWCADFAQHAPGGGESLVQLWRRCEGVLAELAGAQTQIVGHAGWIQAAQRIAAGRALPASAADWQPAPGHGQCLRLWSSA